MKGISSTWIEEVNESQSKKFGPSKVCGVWTIRFTQELSMEEPDNTITKAFLPSFVVKKRQDE